MPKLLLVDDDPFFRDSFSDILSDEGYDIIQAADGKIALDIIKNDQFDLLLLDLNMPRVSGMDVLKSVSKTHPAALGAAAAVFINRPHAPTSGLVADKVKGEFIIGKAALYQPCAT